MNHKQSLPWTAITYPQDFSDEGAALGPQTILRLQRIVTAEKNGEYMISSVVLACGIGPDKDQYPRQTLSFSDMMKRWLIDEGTFPSTVIYSSSNHQAWNCIEVTLEMIRMIKEKDLPRNILVISTGFHIYPRMWTTWN